MKNSNEDGEPALSPENPSFPGPPMTPSQDRQRAPGGDISSSSTGRIKARPILDASAIPLPGGESVNSAQLDLPDIHMLKISQILMRLRTCKIFAIGDISDFFFFTSYRANHDLSHKSIVQKGWTGKWRTNL